MDITIDDPIPSLDPICGETILHIVRMMLSSNSRDSSICDRVIHEKGDGVTVWVSD